MSLYERAAALVPPTDLDLALEIELGDALLWAGRGDDALRRANALAERASVAGDHVGELCARIQACVLRVTIEPEGATERLAALLEEALPVFEAASDHLARYIAYSAVSDVEWERGRMDAALEAWEVALEHAQHAGIQPLELGESSILPHAAANRARALYALGQLDEAEAWAVRAEELASESWTWTEMLWRQVRAKVHARRGEHADAERLAREAVAICDETELLDQQGDAYADLAEVLLLTGKPDEAAAALEQALERYERKGNLVSAQRAQTRLTELQDAAPQ
jgi:tetratricopeptide (TPR) repeat protein